MSAYYCETCDQKRDRKWHGYVVINDTPVCEECYSDMVDPVDVEYTMVRGEDHSPEEFSDPRELGVIVVWLLVLFAVAAITGLLIAPEAAWLGVLLGMVPVVYVLIARLKEI